MSDDKDYTVDDQQDYMDEDPDYTAEDQENLADEDGYETDQENYDPPPEGRPVTQVPTEASAETRETVEGLPHWKLGAKSANDGRYTVAYLGPKIRSYPNPADVTVINSEVWFKTPPLGAKTIRRLNSIQLFTESHDQGFCDDVTKGNWTWFELGIYEDADSESPIKKGEIELIWQSHYNSFSDSKFGFFEGELFQEHHDLIRNLQEGNVIGVRFCTRFQGWSITAKSGYIVMDLGKETRDREKPPPYEDIAHKVTAIQSALQDVNAEIGVSHAPCIPDGFMRADVFGTGGERSLRVLSLDGGGIRGLISLQLLKAVFDEAKLNKKPCEVFDMIGGTSTGGLIAIMLGRLEMDIDECIEEYKKVMGKVFPQGSWKTWRWIRHGEKYDEKPLEEAIQAVVKKKLGDADAKLIDIENKTKCKIFVLAVKQDNANNRAPVFLRSYLSKSGPPELPNIKIWEAARATSAAPTFFKALTVGDYKLVDGGLGSNNPLGWLWTEVLSEFGPARSTDCFLSIGTGIQKNADVTSTNIATGSAHVVKGMISIATGSEVTHVLFRTLIDAFAPKPVCKKYWRLNIGPHINDLEDQLSAKEKPEKEETFELGEMDDTSVLPRLKTVTEQYIKDNILFTQCAKSLTLAA